MFCYQCEQTAKGEGCTKQGVCGKSPDTAALQDLLVYALKGLSQVALAAEALGIRDNEVDVFTAEATFATLTNVSFDPERIAAACPALYGATRTLGGPGGTKGRHASERRTPPRSLRKLPSKA